MQSLRQIPSVDNPSPQELGAAAEARFIKLSRLADGLLEEIEGADSLTAELLRAEATRLYAVSFEIAHALSRDNPEMAYFISRGDAVDGISLGLSA